MFESSSFSSSPIRQQRPTIILAVLSATCMFFTIFFVYNSSLSNPYLPDLVFKRTERIILVLSIMSQATVFLLAELTTAALEAVRWAFVCSPSGISAVTFLSLSRATNLMGTINLLGATGSSPWRFQNDDHRLWGMQK